MAVAAVPILIATLVAATATAAQGMAVSRRQGKLDAATIEANRQQGKLAASEKALSNARGFRRSLANQLAMSNFRGGPGSSIASQFGIDSMSSFVQDQKAIQRGSKNIDTTASLALGSSSLARAGRDLSTMSNFASSTLGALNMSSATSGGSTPKGK